MMDTQRRRSSFSMISLWSRNICCPTSSSRVESSFCTRSDLMVPVCCGMMSVPQQTGGNPADKCNLKMLDCTVHLSTLQEGYIVQTADGNSSTLLLLQLSAELDQGLPRGQLLVQFVTSRSNELLTSWEAIKLSHVANVGFVLVRRYITFVEQVATTLYNSHTFVQ